MNAITESGAVVLERDRIRFLRDALKLAHDLEDNNVAAGSHMHTLITELYDEDDLSKMPAWAKYTFDDTEHWPWFYESRDMCSDFISEWGEESFIVAIEEYLKFTGQEGVMQ